MSSSNNRGDLEFGGGGNINITGTSLVNLPKAYVVIFDTDTEISTLVWEDDYKGDSFAARTFPAGFKLAGSFKSITLTSGSGVAYIRE
jgi:hypothetical protein